MKKKYIIAFLFLLFFNINSIKADIKEEAEENSCEELIEDGILKKDNPNVLYVPEDKYNVNCVYYYNTGFLFTKKCNILQLSYNTENGEFHWDALVPSAYKNRYKFVTTNRKNVTEEDLKGYSAGCPINMYYTEEKDADNPAIRTDVFILGHKSPNMTRFYATALDFEVPPLVVEKCDPSKEKCQKLNCKEIIGEGGVALLKTIYNLFRIGVPIILLVLGILDFAQAIFSSNEEGMKKAQSKFMKRVLIAVIIFLIPSVLHFILKIAHEIWPIIDDSLCGVLD